MDFSRFIVCHLTRLFGVGCTPAHATSAAQLSGEDYQCVTKKEAKETYLLPEGTIAVLKFVERDNPHHSSWTKVRQLESLELKRGAVVCNKACLSLLQP